MENVRATQRVRIRSMAVTNQNCILKCRRHARDSNTKGKRVGGADSNTIAIVGSTWQMAAWEFYHISVITQYFTTGFRRATDYPRASPRDKGKTNALTTNNKKGHPLTGNCQCVSEWPLGGSLFKLVFVYPSGRYSRKSSSSQLVV